MVGVDFAAKDIHRPCHIVDRFISFFYSFFFVVVEQFFFYLYMLSLNGAYVCVVSK